MFDLKNGPKNSTIASLCLCLNHRQSLNFFQILNTKSSKIFSQRSKKIQPLNSLAKFFILFYQSTFSYFLGGNCRYYPTCSHYASECFSKHGFFSALGLTTTRLLSCHPFSRRSVFDPVPLPAPLSDQRKEIE